MSYCFLYIFWHGQKLSADANMYQKCHVYIYPPSILSPLATTCPRVVSNECHISRFNSCSRVLRGERFIPYLESVYGKNVKKSWPFPPCQVSATGGVSHGSGLPAKLPRARRFSRCIGRRDHRFLRKARPDPAQEIEKSDRQVIL